MGKSNALIRSRHLCFVPRKRCYRLPLAEHRKILRLRRRGAAGARLGFETTKIISNENQTNAKQFQTGPLEDFPAFFAASRPDARAEHGPV